MSSDSGGAAGEPVAREDLIRYFRKACLESRGGPPRIGVEHELLPVDPRTGEARGYSGPSGVEGVLFDLLARGFEDPDRRAHPTAVVRAGLTVNLEPGAQTELSGTAHETLAGVERELLDHWALLRNAAERRGFCYLSHGIQPVSRAHEIEQVPKRRYAIMTAYFEARGGPLFRDMMRRTASVQASFDFEDEADAGRKLRLALLAAPVAAALFANSPIAGGRPSGFLSERTAVWLGTDGARSGLVPEAIAGEWSFERYVDFALRVPAILVRAPDGGVAPAGGRTFGELLARGTGERPVTLADWELHLSTIFTDARLRGLVETRSCDGPRPADAMAVPAFWTGLLYDRAALEGATALLAPFAPKWQALKAAAAREALAARADRATTLFDLARDLVKLAAAGLLRRGRGEERYLAAAEEIVRAKKTAAERVLERFEKNGIAAVIADGAV
jgi:glutamate--cysteine ligase